MRPGCQPVCLRRQKVGLRGPFEYGTFPGNRQIGSQRGTMARAGERDEGAKQAAQMRPRSKTGRKESSEWWFEGEGLRCGAEVLEAGLGVSWFRFVSGGSSESGWRRSPCAFDNGRWEFRPRPDVAEVKTEEEGDIMLTSLHSSAPLRSCLTSYTNHRASGRCHSPEPCFRTGKGRLAGVMDCLTNPPVFGLRRGAHRHHSHHRDNSNRRGKC